MSTNIQPHSIPSTRGAVFPHLLTVPPFALPVAKTKPSSSPSSTAPSTPNPNEERHWVKITSGNNTGILAKHPSSDRSGALRDSGVSLPARPSSSISSSSGSKSRTSSSGSSSYSSAPRPALHSQPVNADAIEEDWEVVYPDE